MLAGIFLVISLFTLNLTVVDGKIYGFILYANLVAGNSFDVRATSFYTFVIIEPGFRNRNVFLQWND